MELALAIPANRLILRLNFTCYEAFIAAGCFGHFGGSSHGPIALACCFVQQYGIATKRFSDAMGLG
jgi:hypothetical protein